MLAPRRSSRPSRPLKNRAAYSSTLVRSKISNIGPNRRFNKLDFDKACSTPGLKNLPLEDWYLPAARQALAATPEGKALLESNDQNLAAVVAEAFPSHRWLPWKFKPLPRHYWNDSNHQKQFVDWLGVQLGISQLEGWYQVSHDDFVQNGGYQLLELYSNSPIKLLSSVFPEHRWLAWNFDRLPRSWMADLTHQREFLEWAAGQLHIKNLSDWYNTNPNQELIALPKAKTLLAQYNGSMVAMLSTLYPSHDWQVWRFNHVPSDWWDDPTHHRLFMDQLAKHHQYHQLSDLYRVTKFHISQFGGSALLKKYGGSIRRLLFEVYPEHNWESWRFKTTDKGFWKQTTSPDTLKAVKKVLQRIETEYQITQADLNAWYSVAVRTLGGGVKRVLRDVGGLTGALRLVYPSHPWNAKLLAKGSFAGKKESLQAYLRYVVTDLNLGKVVINKYTSKSLEYLSTRHQIELDIMVKDERLAFEYQGEQHYFDLAIYGDQIDTFQRDAERRVACIALNITLLEVPYWWDENADSLLNTIRLDRPDLVPRPVGDGLPIPVEPVYRPTPKRLSMKDVKDAE